MSNNHFGPLISKTPLNNFCQQFNRQFLGIEQINGVLFILKSSQFCLKMFNSLLSNIKTDMLLASGKRKRFATLFIGWHTPGNPLNRRRRILTDNLSNFTQMSLGWRLLLCNIFINSLWRLTAKMPLIISLKFSTAFWTNPHYNPSLLI